MQLASKWVACGSTWEAPGCCSSRTRARRGGRACVSSLEVRGGDEPDRAVVVDEGPRAGTRGAHDADDQRLRDRAESLPARGRRVANDQGRDGNLRLVRIGHDVRLVLAIVIGVDIAVDRTTRGWR